MNEIQMALSRALKFLYAPSSPQEQVKVDPIATAVGSSLAQWVTQPPEPGFIEEAVDKFDPFLTGMTKALKGTKVFHGTENLKSLRSSNINPEVEQKVEKKLSAVHDWAMRTNNMDSYWKSFQEEVEKLVGGKATFQHFKPEMSALGAGGDLYGKGIYLTEHPAVAKSYAGAKGVVRAQNIPPQAKIIPVEHPIDENQALHIIMYGLRDHLDFAWEGATAKNMDKYRDFVAGALDYVTENPGKISLETFINNADRTLRSSGLLKEGVDTKKFWGSAARALGYDGVSFPAGRIGGLPSGVPEGTRNYVIYNYDVINKPREILKRSVEKATKK